MKQALSILLEYLTCTDPVMITKFQNLLASFWHKDEGKVVTTITQDTEKTEITTKDGNGDSETTSIPIYTEPTTFSITKISGLQDALNDKVDRVAGKGLSTNDFTNALQQKLNGLSNYVHPNTHAISEVDGLQLILNQLQTAVAAFDRSKSEFTPSADAASEIFTLPNSRPVEQVINDGFSIPSTEYVQNGDQLAITPNGGLSATGYVQVYQ